MKQVVQLSSVQIKGENPAQLQQVDDACFPIPVHSNLFEESSINAVVTVPLITDVNNKNIGI